MAAAKRGESYTPANPIRDAETGKRRQEGILLLTSIEAGLARVEQFPLLTAQQVGQAISGHAMGLLKLDKERLTSLRLLGEYYGLWGAGRKPPATERGAKSEGFSIRQT